MGFKIALLKAVLNMLNTVLSLLGIGLIALSVYELNTSTPGTAEHIAIVIQIFIGSFVILTSFLGCFGACRESIGMTGSYAICLLILLAFQVYIIVVAHITDYAQNASDNFETLWNNASINFAEISVIEQRHNCCGRNGSQDYLQLGRAIPKNCYANFERTSQHLFAEGCLVVVRRNAAHSGNKGLLIKWILLFVELCAVGFSGLLGITIRHKQRRQEFHN